MRVRLNPPTPEQIVRRRAIALVIAVLCLGGIVALLLSGVGRESDDSTTNSRPLIRSGPTQQEREERAIKEVLSYTPFVSRGSSRKREVALTFDDGPGPYTDEIVRTLVKTNTPATFFVVGQALNDFGALLTEELRAGLTVANHTENHAALRRLPRREQVLQIIDANARLRTRNAPRPHLFRPPYGSFDATTLKVLRKLNMLMVMWTVDTADYRRPGVRAIVNAAVKSAKPGAIILLHDGGGDRSQTVQALPYIIKKLRRRHYRLVSVPQLLLDDPPSRNQKLPNLHGAER